MESTDVTRGLRAGLTALSHAATLLAPAHAGERPRTDARAGLDLAAAAAQRWSADARLVYVENDEPLGADGRAARWGYLFRSDSLGLSRAYSVRDGRILVAEDLAMRFEAPPLSGPWIDSAEALAEAERGGGEAFRTRHQGAARTMVLMRGAFQDQDPDAATWTVVYTAPDAPALFVMVDAREGRVRRSWRG